MSNSNNDLTPATPLQRGLGFFQWLLLMIPLLIIAAFEAWPWQSTIVATTILILVALWLKRKIQRKLFGSWFKERKKDRNALAGGIGAWFNEHYPGGYDKQGKWHDLPRK